MVVKIGSRLLAEAPASRPATIADQIALLRRRGVEVIVVSSGAIALGMKRLKLATRPTEMPMLQAAAAVGQSKLMQYWEHAFDAHDVEIGQVLVTHDDLGDRRRFLSARLTLRALLDAGCRADHQRERHGRDRGDQVRRQRPARRARVQPRQRGLLVILTDVEGVRDASGVRMPIVRDIDREAVPVAGGSTSGVGSGGMASKVGSARIVTRTGVAAIVAPGRHPDVLVQVLGGADVGTLFVPAEKLSSRKHWIAYGAKPAGKLVIDDGAVKALRDLGKSLLPAGIVSVDGDFELGDTVSIVTRDGAELARGLAAYPGSDLRKIQGLQSAGIEARLGYKSIDEAIHRDDLVIL